MRKLYDGLLWCKDCNMKIGEIDWGSLTPTKEVRCTKCALKEFGIE